MVELKKNKIKRLRHLIIIALAALMLFSKTNCNTNDDDLYKLEIASSIDSFTGYYYIDGNRNTIDPAEIIFENDTYFYEKSLGSLTTLILQVNGASTATARIDVYLFRDKDLVGTEFGTSSNNSYVASVSFKYTAPDTRD